MSTELVLEVSGHARWLPLPVDADDVDAAAAALVEEVTRGTQIDRDVRDRWTAGVAGHTRAVRAQDPAGEGGLHSAFALLPQPGDLTTTGTALLRVLPLPPDLVGDALVEAVVAGRPRHGDVDVDDLDPGGILVRWRPVVLVDDERRVHEERLALWPRPDEDLLVVLSFYCLDLVEAGRAAEAFRQLAAGIRLGTAS